MFFNRFPILLFKTSIAWCNLLQRRSQFMTALMAIAFVVFLMFSQLSFRYAVARTSAAFIQELDADLVMVHRNRRVSHLEITFDQERLYQARNLEPVTEVAPLYITLGSWRSLNSREERPIRVFAFDPDRPVFSTPIIRQWQAALKQPNRILTDRKSKAVYGDLSPGASAELSGHEVVIVDQFSLGSNFVAEGNLVTADQTFFTWFGQQPSGVTGTIRSSPQQVDLGIIRLKPGIDSAWVARSLNQLLPDDVVVKSKQSLLKEEEKFWIRSTAIGFIFELGAALAFVVGIVMVYNIIYTNIDENIPQYGTLRAMGHSHFYLLRIIFTQSLIVAVAGFIPGFLLSSLLCRLISQLTGLVLLLPPPVVYFVLIMTIMMCLLSGFFAATRLRQLDPADIYA